MSAAQEEAVDSPMLLSDKLPFIDNLTNCLQHKMLSKKSSWTKDANNYFTDEVDGSWWVEPDEEATCLVFKGQLFYDDVDKNKKKKRKAFNPTKKIVIVKPFKAHNMCYFYASLGGSYREKNRIFINVHSMWDEQKINPEITKWGLKKAEEGAGYIFNSSVITNSSWVATYKLALEGGQVTEQGPPSTAEQEALQELENETAVDFIEEPEPVVQQATAKSLAAQRQQEADEPFGNPNTFPIIGSPKKPKVVELQVRNHLQTVKSSLASLAGDENSNTIPSESRRG